jgi:hypothetical protein
MVAHHWQNGPSEEEQLAWALKESASAAGVDEATEAESAVPSGSAAPDLHPPAVDDGGEWTEVTTERVRPMDTEPAPEPESEPAEVTATSSALVFCHHTDGVTDTASLTAATPSASVPGGAASPPAGAGAGAGGEEVGRTATLQQVPTAVATSAPAAKGKKGKKGAFAPVTGKSEHRKQQHQQHQDEDQQQQQPGQAETVHGASGALEQELHALTQANIFLSAQNRDLEQNIAEMTHMMTEHKYTEVLKGTVLLAHGCCPTLDSAFALDVGDPAGMYTSSYRVKMDCCSR